MSGIRCIDDIVCFSREIEDYFIDFIPGNSVLIVTFEAAGQPFIRDDSKRLGWGGKYFVEQPWSILWVKPKRVDWYRKKGIMDYLSDLADTGFFDNYDKVVFAGGSMGGYAALSYSSLVDGATVIAISPQSTLSRNIVPWDNRKSIQEGLKYKWDNGFVDGGLLSSKCEKIYIIYDPFNSHDTMHARRVTNARTIHLHTPFLGHSVPVHLKSSGILKPILESAVNGDLTVSNFRSMIKKQEFCQNTMSS